MLTHLNNNINPESVNTIRRPESLNLQCRERRHTDTVSTPEVIKNDRHDLEKWMEQQKMFTLSAVLENQFSLDVGNTNGDQSCYMRTMISNLLENQLTLSAALDETREACAHLNFEKAELAVSGSQELCDLQMEISLCRQREAEIQLAYEELQHRVESIDKIIEEIPWLDFIFNSKEPLANRVKIINTDRLMEKYEMKQETKTPHLSPLHQPIPFKMSARESNTAESSIRRVCRSGSISPLGDSGCPSESHDDFSIASLTSAHSSPYIYSQNTQTGDLDNQSFSASSKMNARSHLSIDPKNLSIYSSQNSQAPRIAVPIQMRESQSAKQQAGQRTVSTFGRITDSLKKSITKFADKSEWKMEALRSQQREARTMLMLNESQSEVRKAKARCCGLKRLQDQQEARIQIYIDEMERLKSNERQLRRELRTWQQRVFEVETENQEIQHNSKIVDLESKSRLLEANMRLSQMEQLLQHKSAYSDLLSTPNPLLGSEKSSSCLDLKAQIGDRRSFMNVANEGFAGVGKPPKMNRCLDTPGLAQMEQMRNLRHRFASTSNLSGSRCFGQIRFDMMIPEDQVSKVGRTSSTYQLKMPPDELRGKCGSTDIRTISFGSLSELELKTDI